MYNNTFIKPLNTTKTKPLGNISRDKLGKIYADVPLSYFDSIADLKKYAKGLADIGVNVFLILPHFLPSFSPYVVSDYEKPCALFGDWDTFAEFMNYIKELGMDRMIDIPFNHCDWQAANIKREWFKNYAEGGIEAGADDVDADNKRIRINWGAFILDNSIEELQKFWLEKVIFPHIDKYNVNAIRIDAAWGLDPGGLKNIVSAVKKRNPEVWFLAENLGMDELINLAQSGIDAGADRFFNNAYWYTSGTAIPKDILKLYKKSDGVPTCTLFSSHDVLMPAMKSYAVIKNKVVAGMNDKAIIRQFVEYDSISKLKDLPEAVKKEILDLMKLDFLLLSFISSDVMFVAGSEKALFQKVDVCSSNSEDFGMGIESDFSVFMKNIINIKKSDEIFNAEGVFIPFGSWEKEIRGLKGFVKYIKKGRALFVAVNNNVEETVTLRIPRKMRSCETLYCNNGQEIFEMNQDSLQARIELPPKKALIIYS